MKLKFLCIVLSCLLLLGACAADTPNNDIAENDNIVVSDDVQTQESPIVDTADIDVEAEDASVEPNIEFRVLETGYMSQTPILCGDYLVFPTYDQPSNYDERIPLLRIMDINSGEVVEEIAFGKENRHYRLSNYIHRNTENYPTHELGPIAKVLHINRGNRMVSLTSTASKAIGLKEYIKKLREQKQ